MMKHVHRVSNLANEDVNLVGMLDQTWSILHGSLTLISFKFACKSIYSFGDTLGWKTLFKSVIFAVFRPLFVVEFPVKNCCLLD